jgi:putative hydrolase of HD superfamily
MKTATAPTQSTSATTAKPPSTLPHDTNFLFEMGNIRYIDRMWRRFYTGGNFANLAEHHFRTFWIAMIIAAHEDNVDTGKLAKLVMVHDINESRTGDVDYLSRQYVAQNDELAVDDMLGDTALKNEFVALWHECKERKTIEAQIVKDADNLDIDFELAEQAAHGNPLQELWQGNREFVARNKLYTATAKKIFDQLANTNPHTWHLEGRNRRNSGDWQK